MQGTGCWICVVYSSCVPSNLIDDILSWWRQMCNSVFIHNQNVKMNQIWPFQEVRFLTKSLCCWIDIEKLKTEDRLFGKIHFHFNPVLNLKSLKITIINAFRIPTRIPLTWSFYTRARCSVLSHVTICKKKILVRFSWICADSKWVKSINPRLRMCTG